MWRQRTVGLRAAIKISASSATICSITLPTAVKNGCSCGRGIFHFSHSFRISSDIYRCSSTACTRCIRTLGNGVVCMRGSVEVPRHTHTDLVAVLCTPGALLQVPLGGRYYSIFILISLPCLRCPRVSVHTRTPRVAYRFYAVTLLHNTINFYLSDFSVSRCATVLTEWGIPAVRSRQVRYTPLSTTHNHWNTHTHRRTQTQLRSRPQTVRFYDEPNLTYNYYCLKSLELLTTVPQSGHRARSYGVGVQSVARLNTSTVGT